MKLIVEIEREDDGRWLAEIGELPGVLAYGVSEAEAKAKAQALALRVIADRLEHGEQDPSLQDISFAAAGAFGRALEPGKSSQLSFESGGRSNANLARRIKFSADPASLTTSSHSTTTKKLVQRCWLASPGTLGGSPKIYKTIEPL